MGTSLTGTRISDTYDGLLKTTDNEPLTSNLKEITDGLGNDSGVHMDQNGNLKAEGTLEFGSLKDTGEDITVEKFVDEADGIANNDNDTTVPTSAAVKDYVDTQITLEDLDFQGDSGTGAIDLDSQVLDIAGGTGITTTALDQTLTVDIDSTVATLDGSQTLTNKSVDLADNTVTGTTAEFNSALSDGDFATLAGTETLTNKSIDADDNTVSNLETDNLKAGVLDTDLTSVSSSDDTLASAKAIKTYVDDQITAEDLDFSGDSGTGSVDLDSQTFAITGANGLTTTAANQGLVVDGSTLQSSISTNASNISTNTTDIATNTSDIATNTSNISTNTSNISTNTSNISTNTSNISTNASNISTNEADIIANGSDIATNTSNISTNTSNISTNTSSISTNATNITSNADNIQTNADDIGDLQTDVGNRVSKSGDTMTGTLTNSTAGDAIIVSASNAKVAIRKSSASAALDVNGATKISSALTVGGSDKNLFVPATDKYVQMKKYGIGQAPDLAAQSVQTSTYPAYTLAVGNTGKLLEDWRYETWKINPSFFETNVGGVGYKEITLLQATTGAQGESDYLILDSVELLVLGEDNSERGGFGGADSDPLFFLRTSQGDTQQLWNYSLKSYRDNQGTYVTRPPINYDFISNTQSTTFREGKNVIFGARRLNKPDPGTGATFPAKPFFLTIKYKRKRRQQMVNGVYNNVT